MGLVDPDIRADHSVADYVVRGRAFAQSRIDSRRRFLTGIAPPCEQLRWIDPYAPCHRETLTPGSMLSATA
ncbi:hypothetical protein [Rhizobium mongolense]|uniref:hypothetical protein n=1 Tax=Rhizobium mongolense TaxID=57676 RepID=UPI0034A1A134